MKTTFQQMIISVHKFKVIVEATDVLHFIVYSNSISYDVRKLLYPDKNNIIYHFKGTLHRSDKPLNPVNLF